MNELPLALVDADNELSPIARAALRELLEEIGQRSARLKQLMQCMRELADTDPAYERLQSIPGIGPIQRPGAARQNRGHGQQFRAGRNCSRLGRLGAATVQHRRTRTSWAVSPKNGGIATSPALADPRCSHRSALDRSTPGRPRSVGSPVTGATPARTRPWSHWPTNSCASPGRCLRKVSRSISPRRSGRSRLDSNPATPGSRSPPSESCDLNERNGHRTCCKPARSSCYEHACVFGLAGSQLTTARSTTDAASRRRIYVRAPFPLISIA